MSHARRIVTEISPVIRFPKAKESEPCCRATIQLDGTVYRCGRGDHAGIHDAFRVHGDDGMVRW